jgi:hypothetical protein
MKRFSDNELESLLDELESDPFDLDLIADKMST